MDARFVTNRQRNTSSVGDMIKRLFRRSPEDDWLVMMYKIPNENGVITKIDIFKTPTLETITEHEQIAYDSWKGQNYLHVSYISIS
jgi:hypothetical protein